MTSRIAFGVCVALTALAVFICVRVEVFNAQVGGLLPRRDLQDHPGNPKWRVEATIVVRRSREAEFRHQAELAGKSFVLTDAQNREIEAAVERARVDAAFREFVSSWGLLQYVLAPFTFLLGLYLAKSRKAPASHRVGAWVMTVAAAACIVLMFYRGYFSSLGW